MRPTSSGSVLPVQPRPGARLALVLLILLMLPAAGPRPACAQTQVGAIVGRVVDERTGQPVRGAAVTLVGGTNGAETDSLGEFRMQGILAGRYTLKVSHIAYGDHTLVLQVAAGVPTEVWLVVSYTAIALDPVNVDVLSAEQLRQRGAGFRRSFVTRDQIARVEGTNMTLPDVLRAHVPTVRIRRLERVAGAPICIELRSARTTSDGACLSPLVYLDGARVADPTSLYGTLDPRVIESMEVIPANEAGVRFGSGALHGALLIETRRPGAAAAHVLSGRRDVFDWKTDQSGHATPRVLVLSAVGNAAGLGLGVLLAQQCLRLRAPSNDGLVSDCPLLPTLLSGAAALALPAAGSGLISRLAGRTMLSQGRLAPSTVGAMMVLVPGYALVMTGKRNDSRGLQNFGYALLFVGAPVVSTTADYLFRSQRGEAMPGLEADSRR